MKKYKWLLFLSLSTNLIGAFIIGFKYIQNDLPKQVMCHSLDEKSTEMVYWLNRQELLESLPVDSQSIVFVGNSLTQNFELSEFFPNVKIKNRGINGDVSAGVLNRIHSIVKLKPSKIFIEIGINDLGTGLTNDSLLKNYKSILEVLQRDCKNSKIYIQSLFPVLNKGGKYPNFCNAQVNANVVKVNKELKQYALERGLTYINVYSFFESEGQLNPNYTVDGIHFNAAGYKTWVQVLKPFVES